MLRAGVSCITDLMVKEGLINLDFADVRTIMAGMGKAMMGTGESSGDRRAIEAALAANPGRPELLEFAGLVAAETGDFAAAARHWRLALAGDPANPATRINLATVLVQMGEHDEACELAAAGAGVSAAPLRSGSINHVSVLVTDMARSIDFYNRVFGLSVQNEDKANKIARLGAGGKVLVSLRVEQTCVRATPRREKRHVRKPVDMGTLVVCRSSTSPRPTSPCAANGCASLSAPPTAPVRPARRCCCSVGSVLASRC